MTDDSSVTMKCQRFSNETEPAAKMLLDVGRETVHGNNGRHLGSGPRDAWMQIECGELLRWGDPT